MDLYRVNEDELPQLGYEEYVFGDGAVAIEWAEKIQPLLPKDYVDVHIRWEEDKRYIHIQGFGKSKEVVRALL
jgi:tRNA threonylcarbamoyladenosine biosynthesis protein TsaE